MSALAEAISAQDFLAIRDLLIVESRSRLRCTLPEATGRCTLVCLMWSLVLVPAAPGVGDVEAIARCMLADTLVLLECG